MVVALVGRTVLTHTKTQGSYYRTRVLGSFPILLDPRLCHGSAGTSALVYIDAWIICETLQIIRAGVPGSGKE